jgi:hypothetical protein
MIIVSRFDMLIFDSGFFINISSVTPVIVEKDNLCLVCYV